MALMPVRSAEKYLFQVNLSAEELDNFPQISKHKSLHVLTTFYHDEENDEIMFDLRGARQAEKKKKILNEQIE